MGASYKGSLIEWIDQHGGATYSADQLFQMAQAEGKDYPYDKIRSARNVRRGVTIVLGPNGVPVRGVINKQMAARPKLGPGEKSRPGFFSDAIHGKPAAPPPVPKKLGRPPKVRETNAEIRERITSVGAAMGANAMAPAEPAAPAVDPRQGALDLGIRKPVAAKATAVAVPVPKAPRRAIQATPEPEHGPHEDNLPPPKHTALRKLILDVGLDVARQIIDEFEDVSERIR